MRKNILNFLYAYKILAWIIPIFNYVIGQSRSKHKRNNLLSTSNANVYKTHIDFCRGIGNAIYVGNQSDLHCSTITIKGNNNVVYFGANSYINGINLIIEGDNNHVHIGNNVFILDDTRLYAVDGSKITIGDGCMLSDHIEIRTTDNHAIFDATGSRINFEQNVVLQEKVWLGTRTIVLKGVTLSKGVIVAAGSVVTRSITTPYSIIAGNPAAIIKQNVTWTMSR
jgi:acetyltransferase-like isoleucine patch superfamily enzyme